MSVRLRRWRAAAAVVVTLLGCGRCLGHDFSMTRVVAVFKGDGDYLIDLRIDLDALALGVSPATPSEEVAAVLRSMPTDELARTADRVRSLIERRVRIRFDGELTSPTGVTLPDFGTTAAGEGGEPSVLGTIARLSGRVPEGATTFSFGASRAFGVVELTVLNADTTSGVRYVLGSGEDFPAFPLHEMAVGQDEFVFARYMTLGFEHILPKGMDHILFVLGLFLLSAQLKPLLWQVTAFTVAHSLTLALSMADVASLPPRLVESLIALSITYVAVENMVVSRLTLWRPVVVFGFGLLHGMGFAGVLREMGLPSGGFATALVGFNVGVEFGQLAVVALAFATVGWFRHRGWYRNGIVRPLSLVIALVGAYWAVERAFY